MPPRSCGCRPNRFGDIIYLGPNEGPAHQAAVDAAHKSFLANRNPDFAITCVFNTFCTTPAHSMMRSDLARESANTAQFLADNPLVEAMQVDSYKSPLSERLMSKLTDFLYTGDYAVVENDIRQYFTDIKIRSSCVTCNNHLRLLCLHLHMFQIGRYMEMELLQLLAMEKFAQAAEGAESIVLQAAVQAVYAMPTWSKPDTCGNAYALAGFYDFRPLLIVQAVVNHISRSRRNGPRWSRQNSRGKGKARWNIMTSNSGDEFRELRKRFPEFDRDIRLAFSVSMGNTSAQSGAFTSPHALAYI